MFNPEFLSLLCRKYSQIEQKNILRAILQDPVIESHVNREEFQKYFVDDQLNSISIFHPANIAANSIGLDISYLTLLFSNPIQPVKPEILQKANDIYQRVIVQKGFKSNLENALFVAFFLRESFFQTKNWQGISKIIYFGEDRGSRECCHFWGLVLGILKNIIPESGELFKQLLIENANHDAIEAVIHALLVNPLSDNELQDEVLIILSQQKIAVSIRFLDLLNQRGFHDVVTGVARNLISLFSQQIIGTEQIGNSLQSINWINADDLAQKIQHIAVLNAFAGEKEKATELIEQVKEILNKQSSTLTKIQEELSEEFQSRNLIDQELISSSDGIDNENLIQLRENSIEEENYILKNSPYKRIRALILLSDFIEADRQLSKLKQNRKSDPVQFCLSAEINICLGGFQEALNDILIAQSLDPTNVSIQQLLSRAYFCKGEYSKAFESMNTLYKSGKEFSNQEIYEFCEFALKNNKPDLVRTICEEKISAGQISGRILLQAAESCLQKKEIVTSLDYLKKSIELDKANPKSWLLLAKIEKSNSENEKALEALITGKKYSDNSQEICFEIVKHNLEIGNYIANESLIEEIINAPLVSVSLTKEIIHTLNDNQKSQSGLDLLNRAIEKWPKNIEIIVFLAELLIENGSYLKASCILEPLYINNQLDTHSLQVFLFSMMQCNPEVFPINAKLSENDLQKVSELMSLLSKISKDDFWTKIIQAEISHIQKNNSEAFNEYRKLLMDFPKTQTDFLWRVQVGMGQVLIEIGQTDTAIALLSEALNQAPSIFEIHQFIADAYISNGLEEKALQIANRGIETFLDNPLFIPWYAKFVSHLQEKDNVIKWLKDKINSQQNSINLTLLLASVEVEIGNNDELATLLKLLIIQSNLSSTQMQLIASIYSKTGNYPQAIDLLNRSLRSPNNEKHLVLFELASLHRQQCNFQESEKALAESLIISDEIDLLNLFLAEIYFSTNNLELLKPILVILEKYYCDEQRSPELSSQLITDYNNFLPNEWKLILEDKENLGIFLAKCFLLTGEKSKSLDFAEKALEINPMNLKLRKYCAELAVAQLLDSKADQFANVDIRSIKDKNEDNEYYLDLVCIRAELALKRGEDLNSASLISTSLQGNENNPRLQCLQSRLLNRQGDFENAAKFYEKAKTQIHQLQNNILNINGTDISVIWFLESAKEIGDFEEVSSIFSKIKNSKNYSPALLLAYMKFRIEVEINEKQSDELKILNNRFKIPQNLFGTTPLLEDGIPDYKNESPEFQRWHSLYKMLIGFETHEIKIQEAIDILAFLSFWYRKTNNIEKLVNLCQKYSNNPDVHFQIGQLLMLSNPDESKKHLNEAIALNSHNPFYYAALAYLENENSDPGHAQNAIEQALTIWPNELNWQILAAKMAEKNKDFHKVQFHIEKAYEIDPQNKEIRSKLIEIYFRKGKFNDAAKLIKKSNNKDAESFEELIILAKAALNDNNYKESLEYASKAGQINRNSPIPFTILSTLALKLNKLDKAIEYSRQAIECDPENVDAHLVIAKIIGLQKDQQSALEYLESISKRRITESVLLCEIASLKKELFGTKEALEYLVNFKELNNEDILCILSVLELELNNINEAETYALASLSVNPYQANLKKILGQVAQKKGNLDQAVKYYTEAISCEPENGERYLDACEIYLYRREVIKALEVIEMGMKMINNDWRLFQKTGKIYWEMKEFIKAETMLKQAYEMNPSDQQLKRQLNALTAMNIIHQNQEVIS